MRLYKCFSNFLIIVWCNGHFPNLCVRAKFSASSMSLYEEVVSRLPSPNRWLEQNSEVKIMVIEKPNLPDNVGKSSVGGWFIKNSSKYKP